VKNNIWSEKFFVVSFDGLMTLCLLLLYWTVKNNIWSEKFFVVSFDGLMTLCLLLLRPTVRGTSAGIG
jgi:hypothetical protein